MRERLIYPTIAFKASPGVRVHAAIEQALEQVRAMGGEGLLLIHNDTIMDIKPGTTVESAYREWDTKQRLRNRAS